MEWELMDEEIAGIEESMWPAGYAVAQAQAKKLVEWFLGKHCIHSDYLCEPYMCPDCMAELRREVGLE